MHLDSTCEQLFLTYSRSKTTKQYWPTTVYDIAWQKIDPYLVLYIQCDISEREIITGKNT